MKTESVGLVQYNNQSAVYYCSERKSKAQKLFYNEFLDCESAIVKQMRLPMPACSL